MAGKNWRGKRRPGLIWRVLFGHNGPTRARLKNELEKALRLKLTDTFEVPYRDETGRLRKQVWRIEPDGTTRQVQRQPKKKAAAKKTTSKRAVSQPSKPSRTSETGAAPRRRTAAAPTVRPGRAAPVAERYIQNADGTLAGSSPASPEYRRALRNAEAAGKRANQHAEELLGWRKPRSR